MAIPGELKYQSEEAFIEDFLIPLLYRLGFSLVMNYHGKREFGKGLICGEIDRFGDVVYHGLQAKYDTSISLVGIEEVITDARQAFANPFRHPHKGNEERISTFVAINAGSISDEAKTHYFNSLTYPFGGNVRLIDGKDLLALDKLATYNRGDRRKGEMQWSPLILFLVLLVAGLGVVAWMVAQVVKANRQATAG